MHCDSINAQLKLSMDIQQAISFLKFGFLALTFFWAVLWASHYTEERQKETHKKILPQDELDALAKVGGENWRKDQKLHKLDYKLWSWARGLVLLYALSLIFMLFYIFGERW